MGDVAMAVPVIKNALAQNPDLQITIVSNAFFAPMFAGIDNCNFHPAYLSTTHKGAAGIYELFRELCRANTYDAVADFHQVLRSSLLRTLFKLSGHRTAVINKQRKEKKALTRSTQKVFAQLDTSHQRYAKVLQQLGVKFTLDTTVPVYPRQPLPAAAATLFNQGKKIIGVAPFAQHKEKMYPLQKMKTVVQQLAQQNNVLLFGGGAAEQAVLTGWTTETTGITCAAGNFSFAEELAIISNLDAMISMDSANMHLASLYGVPVISIWGATHPFAGFYGWAQEEDNIVSIDLPCRPCSVFGNKTCHRSDHACMENISTAAILQKTDAVVHPAPNKI